MPLSVSSIGQTEIAPGGAFTFGPFGGSWLFNSAVSNALEAVGFPVIAYGLNYGWHYFHYGSRGGQITAIADVSLTNKSGEDLYRQQYTYNIYNNNSRESVSVTFRETPGNELGTFKIAFTYLEGDRWPGAYGNYGPRIRDVYANILYKPNECLINPLSNSSCEGYRKAYLNQQCSLNTLYDSSCVGYQQAFFNQQCSANPLYSSECVGYQQAFLNQQCSANPMFNPQCAGYIIKIELPDALPSDPIKDSMPKVIADPIIENVLSSKSETTQTVEIPTPPKSREEARKQARETRKVEEAKKTTPQVSIARRQETNVPKGQQEQLVQSIQDAGPDITSYTIVKLPDIPFYPTTEIYTSSRIRDNERALRMMNQRSDRIHGRMVDEQYQR